MMHVLLTGGTGYIGRHLVRVLLERGDSCTVVSRNPRSPESDDRVRLVQADPTGPGPWQTEVEHATAIVNLAGARLVDPPHRWTAARKRVIRDSRIETTRRLSEAIQQANDPPRVFVSGSAVGYYGSRGDEPLTETAPPGNDFLATLCIDWERAARAAEQRTRIVAIRTGLVLGKNSPLLHSMLPAFKLGLGGPWGDGTQWWPWIHIDDVTGLICHALDGEAPGPLNVTAPQPVRVAAFAAALGKAIGRPAVARVPGFVLRMALGEVADALLVSQRVVPQRALAIGYAFRYTDLTSALGNVFGN